MTLGHDHPVPVINVGLVARLVGTAKQIVDRLAWSPLCNADTGGDRRAVLTAINGGDR